MRKRANIFWNITNVSSNSWGHCDDHPLEIEWQKYCYSFTLSSKPCNLQTHIFKAGLWGLACSPLQKQPTIFSTIIFFSWQKGLGDSIPCNLGWTNSLHVEDIFEPLPSFPTPVLVLQSCTPRPGYVMWGTEPMAFCLLIVFYQLRYLRRLLSSSLNLQAVPDLYPAHLFLPLLTGSILSFFTLLWQNTRWDIRRTGVYFHSRFVLVQSIMAE